MLLISDLTRRQFTEMANADTHQSSRQRFIQTVYSEQYLPTFPSISRLLFERRIGLITRSLKSSYARRRRARAPLSSVSAWDENVSGFSVDRNNKKFCAVQ